jgi:hypothetical protein
MYVKLFASLYQGTLRGKPDEILVFTNLLAHADQNGIVDMHWQAVADETGLPRERVEAAIKTLEMPDPESRSPEMNGSRIVKMDEHRAWGWAIVNYAKYRAIRNEDDRREQNRVAQEKWRNKHRKHSKPRSAQAEEEAEAEAYTSTQAKACGVSDDGNQKCPHDKIISLYHQTLPLNPKVKVWNNTRSAHLRQRWREYPSIEEWSEFFNRVSKSKFLTGKVSSGTRKPFLASLDWLIKPENFAKVLEGKYE